MKRLLCIFAALLVTGCVVHVEPIEHPQEEDSQVIEPVAEPIIKDDTVFALAKEIAFGKETYTSEMFDITIQTITQDHILVATVENLLHTPVTFTNDYSLVRIKDDVRENHSDTNS